MSKTLSIDIVAMDHGVHIKREREGRDRFTVTYGQQIKRKLNYEQAASELGSCIMHSMICKGSLGYGPDDGEHNGQ